MDTCEPRRISISGSTPRRPTQRASGGRLIAFGAPLHDLSVDDLSTPGTIYQIGVEPNRIDIINDIGLDWAAAWKNRVVTRLGDLEVGSLGRADLIAAKRIAGRPEDLRDIEVLERQ